MIINIMIGIVPILIIFIIFFAVNRHQARIQVEEKLTELIDQFNLYLERDTSRLRVLSYLITMQYPLSEETNETWNFDAITTLRWDLKIYEVFLSTNLVRREIQYWKDDFHYLTDTETATYIWKYLNKPMNTSYFTMSFPDVISNVVAVRNCAIISDPRTEEKIGFAAIVTPINHQYLYELPFLENEFEYVIITEEGMVFSETLLQTNLVISALRKEIEKGSHKPFIVADFGEIGKYYFKKDILYTTMEKYSNRMQQKTIAEIGILYDYATINSNLRHYQNIALPVTLACMIIIIIISYFISKSITEPILDLKRNVEIFEKRMDPIPQPEEAIDEIGQLYQSVGKMTYTIIDKTRQLEERDKLIARDLRMAGEIQVSLLPEPIPVWHHIKVVTRYFPLFDVGGDFYDIFHLPHKKYGVMIADASGHGMPAALYTVLAKRAFYKASTLSSSPKEILTHVNNELMEVESTGHYLSGVFFSFSEKGKVVYSNAGHPPTILIKKTGECVLLEDEGTYLGAMDFAGDTFTDSEINFKKGDKILMYTDCLYESVNHLNQPYGSDRLLNVISRFYELSINELIGEIMKDFHFFVGETDIRDDLTIVGIEHI